jgi:peptidoglycan/xylan/chitin deacetylase (PgdA/CDA1 family)
MGSMINPTSVKRIAKVVVSLIYYGLRGVSRFFLRLIGRPTRGGLVILYYHGIPSGNRSSFVRQMESIRKRARVFPAYYRGHLSSERPNVAITFDDAYVSVAENALPELSTRGFHATIFVPTGCLGAPPAWAIEDGSLDADEVVMSEQQIKSLSSALVTLGSHTSTHPRLSQIGVIAAQNEIEGSRLALQTVTGQDIRLLAFPYGDHNASIVELCKGGGYNIVFSVIPAIVDPENFNFVRGRVKVDPFDWPLEFYLKYHGAYAWATQVPRLKRKIGGRDQVNETGPPFYGRPS